MATLASPTLTPGSTPHSPQAMGQRLITDAWRGDKASVKQLLECGADITVKNKDGQTAWEVATTNEIKALLRKVRRGWRGGAIQRGAVRSE